MKREVEDPAADAEGNDNDDQDQDEPAPAGHLCEVVLG